MIEKEPVENQFAAWKPYPNTTDLAGFMKVNDTPATGS
jgi:hypothetical protein